MTLVKYKSQMGFPSPYALSQQLQIVGGGGGGGGVIFQQKYIVEVEWKSHETACRLT